MLTCHVCRYCILALHDKAVTLDVVFDDRKGNIHFRIIHIHVCDVAEIDKVSESTMKIVRYDGVYK